MRSVEKTVNFYLDSKQQEEIRRSDAEQCGIDLWLLYENMRLSPDERLVKHQQALDLVFALEEAGKLLET